MKDIDIKRTIERLLVADPTLRETKNIKRVVWNVYHNMGALDTKGDLPFKSYMKAASMETITRILRKVKKERGWSDELAKELERKKREQYGKS